MCEHGDTQIKWKLQKEQLSRWGCMFFTLIVSNRLTSDDEAIYSARSNDGQICIGVHKLNGRPVKVLRDTGCTGMIVDRALIPDLMVIPGISGSLQMVDGFSILQRTLKSDVCQLPIYPVIIGNVRGAHQMLPDSRKSRKELELIPVGATTMTMTTKVVKCLVGCSKRSPTEGKLRLETQRRSRPRPRKTKAVLVFATECKNNVEPARES